MQRSALSIVRSMPFYNDNLISEENRQKIIEENRRNIINSLKGEQQQFLDEIKSELAKEMTQDELERFGISIIGDIFKKFTALHNKELVIQCFSVVIEKFREINEEERLKAAKNCYNLCFQRMKEDCKESKMQFVRKFDQTYNLNYNYDSYLICRDQYFKQIVEASLGYNEATLQEIIYKNINPQEDITQFGFAKWSKESQEEVLKKLRDDQEIEFEQLKLDLAKDISKEALDSLVVAHIKKLYMKFSQFHSEEMTIDYFKEIIKKFQNVQDDDLQIFAQASYKVCMKRAIQDSPDSYICVRPNQDQKDHCSEHDQYFKELLEFSLAYKESDFKNLFGPDYIHGNYARHINKIGSELGGFAKSLGMVANAAEKNTGCTIF